MADRTLLNQQTYDQLAREYDEKVAIRRPYNQRVLQPFTQWITTSKKVLDVGCAVGLDLLIFQELGFVPTGVELSSGMIERARERVPNVPILEGNFMEISFPEPFDALYAQSFIHLFPEAEIGPVFTKIYDLLKPGGVALITTSKAPESKEGWEEKTDYIGSFKRFRKHWTWDELERTIRDYGFQILESYEIRDPYQKLWMRFTVQKPPKGAK